MLVPDAGENVKLTAFGVNLEQADGSDVGLIQDFRNRSQLAKVLPLLAQGDFDHSIDGAIRDQRGIDGLFLEAAEDAVTERRLILLAAGVQSAHDGIVGVEREFGLTAPFGDAARMGERGPDTEERLEQVASDLEPTQPRTVAKPRGSMLTGLEAEA